MLILTAYASSTTSTVALWQAMASSTGAILSDLAYPLEFWLGILIAGIFAIILIRALIKGGRIVLGRKY